MAASLMTCLLEKIVIFKNFSGLSPLSLAVTILNTEIRMACSLVPLVLKCWRPTLGQQVAGATN